MANNLNMASNEIVQMYITARQFKNAIDITEMTIIPAELNKLPENTKLTLGNMYYMTARGNKMINKIFPFIVNKAFACEVFLKIIIKINDLEIPKNKNGHKLSALFNLASSKSDLLDVITNNGKQDKNILYEEIEKISNIFVEWRYIYENTDKARSVNYGFLNTFTDLLDIYVIEKIKLIYSYDVTQDCR